jgi:small-conductance mechanosensitive channel
MATGWIRAIRAVPWNEVIAAAPTVVGSAKRILSALQKKQRGENAASRSGPATPLPVDPELRALHQRIDELKADLVDATEVLENLADQHAQLVVALEALRERTRALVWASALLAAIVLGVLAWLTVR